MWVFCLCRRCEEEIYGSHDITYEEHAFYTTQINESDVSFVYSCDFLLGWSRSTQETDNPLTVSKIFEIKKFEIGLCVQGFDLVNITNCFAFGMLQMLPCTEDVLRDHIPQTVVAINHYLEHRPSPDDQSKGPIYFTNYSMVI